MTKQESEKTWQPPADIQSILHDYQLLARNFLILTPKAGLFLDVGFGKTLVTLATLQILAMQQAIRGHILVIAPKAIARSTWIDEIHKWGLNPRIVSLIVNERGKQLSKAKRIERYEQIAASPASFYFLNKELVTDLVNWHSENKAAWPFPTVVIDELQGFKSHKSNRFKAMKAVSPYIKRFIGLTGTPTPNGLMDLWPEIFLMDGGRRLGRNITQYRDYFFNEGLKVNGYPVTWRPKTGAEDAIYNAISDVVISIKNPNLKLPPITFHDFQVYMTDEEKEVYKRFAKESVLTVQNQDGSQTEIKAASAAILSAKLSQLASGTIYTGDGKEYIMLHEHKLEALEYIVNNTGSPVIVAYHFQSDRAEIIRYFDKLSLPTETMDGSPEMIRRWNNGEIPILLLQPASVGHGINIQHGGHTLVWYTMPRSLEHYIQTIGRLHRQGQTQPVMIHHLLTDGTIDRHILKRINEKDDSEKALLEAVSKAVEDLGAD